MNILLAPVGSRGDIQPMLALALKLRQRGHAITFAAPPNFAPWVGSMGLPFRPVGRDMQAFLKENGLNVKRALRVLREDLHRHFEEIGALVPGMDLIVGGSIHCAGLSYGEKLRIPYAYVLYTPCIVPSAYHPAPTVPWQHMPRVMNSLSWRGYEGTMNALFRKVLNEDRVRLGLAPVQKVWRHVLSGNLLLASDPALDRPPPDFPFPVVQTGAWFLEETEELEPGLEAFLAEGAAPVYLGFGSMDDRKPEATTRLVLEAIGLAGVRAIVSRGWAGLGSMQMPPGIYLAGPTPHGKLFPRLAAVVHHGGAGTTANAARAGIPQVIVPHLLDQHYLADRVFQRGLGPKPISRRTLEVKTLAAAIRACLEEESLKARARAMASQLLTDGLDRAVAFLEKLAGCTRAPQADLRPDRDARSDAAGGD